MAARGSGRAAARLATGARLAAVGLVVALGASAVSARAQPAPAPEAPIPEAPEVSDVPAPAPPTARMQARVMVTEIDGDEVRRHTFRFYKLGNRVRMEPAESSDPRFDPETLYDYDRRLSFRNLSEDKITFAYRLSLKERVLAQAEGFMTTPPEEPVYRLEVNPDLSFDGHPCTLVLTGFPSPGGRVNALRWVWEAHDLDGLPVKVVFPGGGGVITIVEFLDAATAPFDDGLVQVPEGRPVMSGF
jgi:hypothetical protein